MLIKWLIWTVISLLIICCIHTIITYTVAAWFEHAAKRHIRIIDAINAHHDDCFSKGDWESAKLVSVADLEDLEKTVLRIWDWGYKRILPQEKYEIIKPYLDKEKEDDIT